MGEVHTKNPVGGLAPERIVERGTDQAWTRAVLLNDLEGNVEIAREEFRYEGSPEAEALLAHCAALGELLERLSLTEDGELTFARECDTCGGTGWYVRHNTHAHGGEIVQQQCEECGGRGVVER